MAKQMLPKITLRTKVTDKAVTSAAVNGFRLAFFAEGLVHCAFIFSPFMLHAQVPAIPSSIVEQQLEAITESKEDVETEDDSFLQAMRQFLINPVNLNVADNTSLKELMIFSPIQIQNIISYRKLLGNFISIYELQAVPGFDLPFIERIRPYITVTIPQPVIYTIGERLVGGHSNVLARVTQVLEKQKGFKLEHVSTQNYYPGSRQKMVFRYKYQFKNLLQYGIIAEKDAGEQFFKGGQKQGFDFYSVHLFARNIGVIQSLALGDFTVNLGQGLIQWQGMAFRKGADIPNVKRQLAVLRPYNSPGEINFHRGLGITLAKRNISATTFISYKKMDANFIKDSLNNEDYISSLQTSGYHRTQSEIADKGVQRQFTTGGNVAYNANRLHLGFNIVKYHFKLPIKKSPDPYNFYSISGRSFGNYSFDYSYAFRNLHFFGEAAFSNDLDGAFVNGLIASVDSKIDMSLLYRDISRRYQSLYANAFTENTYPTNEKGLFAGISVKPATFWRIDAYADFYSFPWLKYQVDAPSTGRDYLLQACYKPNKQLEIYLRYRSETKAKNDQSNDWVLSSAVPKPRQNLRSHMSYQLNKSFSVRNRIEMTWFDNKNAGAQEGFLTFFDLIIQPIKKRYSGSIRLQYFETEGYDSRVYAYENDVLFSFSIPVFYDIGYRYYINLNYDVNKKLTLWWRWAQSIYKGKSIIGSGLDEITGNKRSEVKLQVLYRF